MATRIGNVDELFDLKHGLVVVVDQPIAQIPIPIRIGDAVEFRTASGTKLMSRVRGIEHADPWTDKRYFAFLLPREVVRDEVPLRSEVWIVGHAAAEQPNAAMDRPRVERSAKVRVGRRGAGH